MSNLYQKYIRGCLFGKPKRGFQGSEFISEHSPLSLIGSSRFYTGIYWEF
ncbi:hypothetical protein H1P_230002 [Hyella patelloides LEGE 07179]|uniref:Uncharacterized protein n=1 Tax=Hyella patelloides LEGE 07179 TaxID=945734 RepID=A0A563VR52_9CYAN|nr:hypothetical protein H1P_230002 [Hyella patelloides LEGE 07179]